MGNLFSCFKKNSVNVAAVTGGSTKTVPRESIESLTARMKRQENMFVASSFATVEPIKVEQKSHERKPKNTFPPRDSRIIKRIIRRKVSNLALSFSIHFDIKN